MSNTLYSTYPFSIWPIFSYLFFVLKHITKMCQHPFSIWPIFLFLVSILNNKRFLMVPIPKDSCPCRTILLLYASSDIWSPFFHVVCGNHHGGPLKKCILELANFLRTFFPLHKLFFLFTLSFIASFSSLTNISTSLPTVG